MLVIMDGFGCSTSEKDNAVAQADLKVLPKLWQEYPHSYLGASGEDIEHPLAKRFIRKKLNKVNELQAENERLREVIKQKDEEKKKQEKFLKRLATEYVVMGKECERAGMKEAAITNYQKALTLYPSHPEAKKRLKHLKE